MTEHLLRQEQTGGYWVVRAEGRAIELDADSYTLLARSHAAGRSIAAADDPPAALELIRRYGLDWPGAWSAVRHVPLDGSVGEMPMDATVAPKRIYFEITRACNLACRSCFNNSHHALPGELSTDEILDVNRQAWELGVFEIRYTGGECTRREGFRDIVADARRRGFYVSIGTNGVYSEEQLEWLPTCGIDWFIISLDGGRRRNDEVRGRGTFASVVRTLEVLAKRPVRLRLNMVVARHNVDEIASVARVATEHGVGSLNLIPLRPYGRSTKQMVHDIFDQRDFYGFIREVNRLRRQFPEVTFSTTIDLLDPTETTSHDLIVQKKSTCAAGVEACVVGPLGHVYGCSYSPASFPGTGDAEGERVFIAGSLRQDSLRTIWRDSGRWEVFRNLKEYKNPSCHSCGHYGRRCSGSCQIMAWAKLQHEREQAVTGMKIGDFMDPYCFKDLLDERSRTSDLSAPCGGAGMDGF